MDFTLDKKHEMARQLFAEFAEKEVKPLAQETDELEQFPEETVKKISPYCTCSCFSDGKIRT